MEIKTCEEYVLSQLECALKQLEDSKKEIERLNNRITYYNKQLTKCCGDIDYLQRLFIANGSVQSEINHGIKHLEVTYKFKFTSTELDTTEVYNFRKLLEILNIDDDKCYKDNEEE